MCAENCPGPSLRSFSSTTVANSAVFHECAEHIHRHPPNREGDIPELSSSIAEQPTLVTSTVGLTVVQIIRHSLSECRFHQTLPMSSCSLGELVHKNNTKSTSIQFCLQRPQDPQPTVTAVLDFLHSLFKQVLSYSMLNTARSAISNVDMQNNNVQGHTPVGRHMLVCRYLNMRKPTPKYSNFWSVDIVLDYLSSLWPLDQLTLKQLTVELIILIALTTGQRCQTLTFLDVSHDCMEKTENCYNFGLTNHIKQDKPDKLFGTLSLHKYPVKPIGVYETLTFYLESAEKCRKSTSVL